MINIYAHSSCAVEFHFEEHGGDPLCGFGSRLLRAAWPKSPQDPASRAEQNVSLGREQGRPSSPGTSGFIPQNKIPVWSPFL